jgi:DNA-binding CsgD family transcriptional regulator
VLYAAGELAWLAGRNTLARDRIEESEALWRALIDREGDAAGVESKRGLAYVLQSLPMAVDSPRALEAAAESLRLFEEIGDAWGAAMALGAVDVFALIRDGDRAGQARLEESLARIRRLGDDWGAAQMLNILGDLARSRGDDAGAAAHYQEALSLLRRQDLTGTVPSLLHNLGYLALRRGDSRQALRLFQEGLSLFRSQGDQRGIADCLTGVAAALVAWRPERATRLLGAAEALREAIRAEVWPANLADYVRSVGAARSRLDEATFEEAWAAGRTLRLEQAIDDALSDEPADKGIHGADGCDLTPREREVAVLVTAGLTNRQIGARLFITEGTARLHVKHILQKLGFTSRAQIAAWAVDQGLAAAPEGG